MAHESFEDPDVAHLMNERFVNIKVDREERPDLDSIYMTATQLMSGQGGWPMSVFLTPDGKPFFAGTYFPPRDTHGRPGFARVLEAVSDAYRDRRDELSGATARLVERMRQQGVPGSADGNIGPELIESAVDALAADFDAEDGGFGAAPKFPQPMTYEFLLRAWHATGDSRPLEMVETTLDHMARGGIYDQLGGGFHRYSTDHTWLVPHFEKMLYDNALLARLYLHAWQATARERHREVCEGVLAYLEREMLDPSGGFYSSQDADSEGEEGKFFVWWASEIDDSLGPELARVAREYWAVGDNGNFEGRNILWAPRPDEEVASAVATSVEQLRALVNEARRKLFFIREGRGRPGRDEKVLTAWNALALATFAEAGAALGSQRYQEIATASATFLLSTMMPEGRLLRTWKAADAGAGRAALKGYLEDYAFLADALVTFYEATFAERWLEAAIALARQMVELFWDASAGVFYDTGIDHEPLVVRPRDVFDNATPSGGSAAALTLLRLAKLTGDSTLAQIAERSIASVASLLPRAPAGLGHWLAAADFLTSKTTEVAIVGSSANAGMAEMKRVLWTRYLPNRVIAGTDSSDANSPYPLIAGRLAIGGKATAYVCEDYVCNLPVTDPQALAAQLPFPGAQRPAR